MSGLVESRESYGRLRCHMKHPKWARLALLLLLLLLQLTIATGSVYTRMVLGGTVYINSMHLHSIWTMHTVLSEPLRNLYLTVLLDGYCSIRIRCQQTKSLLPKIIEQRVFFPPFMLWTGSLANMNSTMYIMLRVHLPPKTHLIKQELSHQWTVHMLFSYLWYPFRSYYV